MIVWIMRAKHVHHADYDVQWFGNNTILEPADAAKILADSIERWLKDINCKRCLGLSLGPGLGQEQNET